VKPCGCFEVGGEKPADLARELGVPRNKLYKWREQLQNKEPAAAFLGRGRRAPPRSGCGRTGAM